MMIYFRPPVKAMIKGIVSYFMSILSLIPVVIECLKRENGVP